MIYYKVINKEFKHRGFQYKLGLNKLKGKFNPYTTCEPGGFYFAKKKDIIRWLGLGKYICEVELLTDSKLAIGPSKMKTDKFILKNKRLISTFLWKNNLEVKAICEDGNNIRFVKKQTPKLCKLAVKKNVWALKHVKEQTLELCKQAVKQDKWALKLVKDEFKHLI